MDRASVLVLQRDPDLASRLDPRDFALALARGLQTVWRVTDDATQNVRRIDRSYWPSGALHERTGQKRLGGTESPEYTYRYEYDRNGSLSLLRDERKDRTTTFSYDDADRQTLADEQAFNAAEQTRRGKDTKLAYDRNGNVLERLTDGRVQANGNYAGGKTTTFSYDSLDRERSMQVVAGGERTRSTSTDYWPGGERSLRRTDRESVDDDTVERWFRFSDGRLSRMDRKRQGASGFLKERAYDYDLNGNRVRDERGAHEFNSRDQLVLWNPDTAGKPDVAYKLNGSGGIRQRTRGNEITTYSYGPGDERLDHAEVTVGGVPAGTTNYSYDQGFGDVTKYQVVGAPEPAATFVYDAFGRQTRATSDTKDETFSYDGLDRRDTKTAGTKWFDLSYVGLSESLSQETQFEGGDERRSYDYTSTLERVGAARKADGESGDAPYRAYSLDANGSVEGLQDDTGVDSSERYGYDPYGEALDAQGGPQDEADLSPDQQANPFRFEGHYYDAAFKTYDMRARAYLPEIGRFLQEDHYEQALGDQALETDPLTQDRYAFAGGNPLNNIEWDGHRSCGATCRPGEHQQNYGGSVQRIPGKRDPAATDFSGSHDPNPDYGAAYRASQAETKRPTAPPPVMCGGRAGCVPMAPATGDSEAACDSILRFLCEAGDLLADEAGATALHVFWCGPGGPSLRPECQPQLPSLNDLENTYIRDDALRSGGRIFAGLVLAGESRGRGGARMYGPFHRREGPQTVEEMAKARAGKVDQVEGGVNQWALHPSVDARRGPLPPGASGYEFYTPVRPAPLNPKSRPRWPQGYPGVRDLPNGRVAIPCRVTRCQ
jgi:RHS repeat-associated protein